MDFRELTYITAVAEEQSVTKAARKLYISQPSLSYIISKVEEELGAKLFDRKTSPISLTYAGEKYVQTAREILRMRDNMRREINDIGHGEKGRINIGIPNERAAYMLPRVMPAFRKQFPGIEIRLEESRSEEIVHNLMMDKIGFCILPGDGSDLPPGTVSEYLYSEKIYLMAGEGVIPAACIQAAPGGEVKSGKCLLPLADMRKIRKTTPFILQKRGQYIRKKADDIFRRLGFFPREIIEVSSSITAARLAEIGMGVAIVSERVTDELGGIDACGRGRNYQCFRYQEELESWPVSAVYKKDIYLDNSERAFIETVRCVFADKEGSGSVSH